jgi:hypothetical protein
MVKWCTFLLVIAVATATLLATPIPKQKETAAAKLMRLFGKVVGESDECRIQLNKKDQLEIEQTQFHQLYSADHTQTIPPQVTQEVTGDFVATIRCMPYKTEGAALNEELAKKRGPQPVVGVGLSITSGTVNCTCVTTMSLKVKDKQTAGMYWLYRSSGGGSGSSSNSNKAFDKPRYIRFTRKGNKISGAYSDDGKEFRNFGNADATGIGDTVLIGPVMFHNLDKTSSGIFDEFTIEPIKEDK